MTKGWKCDPNEVLVLEKRKVSLTRGYGEKPGQETTRPENSSSCLPSDIWPLLPSPSGSSATLLTLKFSQIQHSIYNQMSPFV